jgi:primosomal protein N' (replication factor Y)
MPQIAKVVASVALDREFDYLVPDDVRATVAVGSRVEVPFGRRRTTGYVVGFSDQSDRPNLKSILSVSEKEPLLDNAVLELARWMAEYYCAPIEKVLKTVLPGSIRRDGAGFKTRLFVTVCEADNESSSQIQQLSPKQSAIWDLLRQRGDMFLRDVTQELGVTASPVRALEQKGLVRIKEATERRDPMANRTILPTTPLSLTDEQTQALQKIVTTWEERRVKSSCAAPWVVLLHGVTGSGKTEVYLQMIARVIAAGQGAIVLVPEISLTPQTVERFVSRFGDEVAVLHSHLSDGERYDEWHRIHSGGASIVIGARSAVFAPVRNLGIIIVDEEHEPSYKQEEAPRYHARDVAVMRSRFNDCIVVLGSATPSLESWANVTRRKYRLASLERRVDNCKMPAVRVVDMRVEAQRTGHVTVLSRELASAISERIARSEQTLLFLNRRGFATSLICPKCGYTSQCDQCSVAHTYHRQNESLRCHLCGSAKSVPAKCPACGDPAFKFAGIGTQRVERIIQKFFPHARVQRMDADVTTKKNSYERILGDFRSGRIDILIGTQMIAKGLHFPNVTLVGVVYADLSLHVPDFRAGERTFQLLTQVAGRAGRGDLSGEVIIQTYTPHHQAVQAARRTDYVGFCEQEMEFRKELEYPPYTHLVCLTLSGASEEKVSFCSNSLVAKINAQFPRSVLVSEPCPAPLARIKGHYRYQVMLRSRLTATITTPLKSLLREISFPRGIRCSVDVDALSIM